MQRWKFSVPLNRTNSNSVVPTKTRSQLPEVSMLIRIASLGGCVVCVAALLFVMRTETTAQPAGVDSDSVTARGRVYHDENGNGKFDPNEELLPGVRVSNGRDIVKTNDSGTYEIEVDNDDAIFVIKPRNWMTPVNEDQLPQFYYIHKPSGSPKTKFPGVKPTGPLPKSVDFALLPQEEPDQFKAILFGDPQPRNVKEVEYIGHDVVEELIGTDASFGVTLGDIVFDDLDVFTPENQAIALIGIPWYNVIGNHDINRDAKSWHQANETFERIYGPSYYSFDHGPTHFIVLDNIEMLINEQSGKSSYRGGLGQDQIEFVKNDLAMIPEDQMVVLLMHIPLKGVNDRHGLYRLIEKRPFCISVSGHTHHHEHVYIKEDDGWKGPKPHHHMVNVTVCGSWWSGAPDDRGIPHAMMADGAPNGYSILKFDGKDYALDFKAAGRPADYQMHIDAPDALASDATGDTTIFVNVFNGGEKTNIKMRVGNGEWTPLEKTREIDPHFTRVYEQEQALLNLEPSAWRKLTKPKGSTHLWKGPLPKSLPVGTHLIEISGTDEFGRPVHGQRIIRIE